MLSPSLGELTQLGPINLVLVSGHRHEHVRVRVRVTLQLTVSQSVHHGVEPNLVLLTRDIFF
jgi:hypothetical protein